MKFDITSALIQLLNLKGVFVILLTDVANMDFVNFNGIYISYAILGLDQEALRLKLFPFSLICKDILC